MKNTGFRKPTLDEVKIKQAEKRARVAATSHTINSKAPKPRKTIKAKARTKRAKKMDMKKKLCEQYNLPPIPCSRWGTAKSPTRTDLLRGMLWTVFSKHIRERDMGKPCITCGRTLEIGNIQAGHYVPVGNSSVVLHFLRENVNGECPTCNADFNGWHLVPMRKNMVWRYGEDVVDKLDYLAGQKTTVKLPEEWYVELIKQYLDEGQMI